MWINVNGDLLPADQPLFTASNRAFRYGDGLFETIKVANGKPLFLSDHISRLELSMHLLSLAPQRYYTVLFFEQEIKRLLDKNGWQHARIRISVFRDANGYYTPAADTAQFLIEGQPLDDPTYQLNQEGFTVTVYPDHFKPFNALAGLKSSSSLLYVLAGIWKRDHGFDELLLLNEHGRVAEAISHNVMLYKDGVVYTPAATEACLSGIMKEIVMVLVNRMNIDARPAFLTLDDVKAADEVWLTNMISGVQWVSQYDDVIYGHALADRVVLALNDYAKL